ncbi:hypothetical protein R50073_50920 (plasmid) [Maricurvus nonylphenolicus]|uniref:hypothetical protein n=1 Tax=Maricurvus nonylphenolicus TaxID=1008307 RepID=UPI0036F24094
MLEGIIKPIISWLLNLLTLGYRDRRVADKELFCKLYSELPLDSDQVFLLKEHDFNQAFSFEYLRPLNYVVADWINPVNRFHNCLVERRKKKFVEKLKIFLDELSQHTAMEESGLVSIGLNDQGAREKVIIKIGKRLNKLSSSAYSDYERFIVSYKKEINS